MLCINSTNVAIKISFTEPSYATNSQGEVHPALVLSHPLITDATIHLNIENLEDRRTHRNLAPQMYILR